MVNTITHGAWIQVLVDSLENSRSAIEYNIKQMLNNGIVTLETSYQDGSEHTQVYLFSGSDKYKNRYSFEYITDENKRQLVTQYPGIIDYFIYDEIENKLEVV